MRNSSLAAALGAVALAVVAIPAQAATVTVLSETSTPTFLASLVAGQTYHVTATGSSNLLAGSALNFDANGLPLGPIGSPYASCYPSGCHTDPTSGAIPVGGSSSLIGALLGTFSASPTGPADYFTLGADYTFTALVSGSLYGQVNDVAAYSDNAKGVGFSVTTSVVGGETGPVGGAVPEPATWALMIAGFGMVGSTLRRRATSLA